MWVPWEMSRIFKKIICFLEIHTSCKHTKGSDMSRKKNKDFKSVSTKLFDQEHIFFNVTLLYFCRTNTLRDMIWDILLKCKEKRHSSRLTLKFCLPVKVCLYYLKITHAHE